MSKFKVGDLIKYQNGMNIRYTIIKKIEENLLWGTYADSPEEAIQEYRDNPKFCEIDTYFNKRFYKYITIINGYDTPLYQTMHKGRNNENN